MKPIHLALALRLCPLAAAFATTLPIHAAASSGLAGGSARSGSIQRPGPDSERFREAGERVRGGGYSVAELTEIVKQVNAIGASDAGPEGYTGVLRVNLDLIDLIKREMGRRQAELLAIEARVGKYLNTRALDAPAEFRADLIRRQDIIHETGTVLPSMQVAAQTVSRELVRKRFGPADADLVRDLVRRSSVGASGFGDELIREAALERSPNR